MATRSISNYCQMSISEGLRLCTIMWRKPQPAESFVLDLRSGIVGWLGEPVQNATDEMPAAWYGVTYATSSSNQGTKGLHQWLTTLTTTNAQVS
jgi:hypothetical protein